MTHYEVVVVGAGAAGLFAAWRAAGLGAHTLLLEKTERIGTKVLISGGGKCNVTHHGEVEELVRVFRPQEGRFLRPSMYRFTNRDVVNEVESRGIELYMREDGRLFPAHGTAKDVVRALGEMLAESGAEVAFHQPVESVDRCEGGYVVRTATQQVHARCVVIATGGSSYPKSGTTGDGWRIAARLGHSIIKPQPALAPIYLKDSTFVQLSGVTLRACTLKARQAGKEFARWHGDLLFTHRGISGPTALHVSRDVAERLPLPVMLEVDIAPDLAYESLGEDQQSWLGSHPRSSVQRWVELFTPKAFAEILLHRSGVSCQAFGSQISKRSRNQLTDLLKRFDLGEVLAVPMEKGEVVAGGVDLSEVNPQTLESNLCPGLYLAGEVLDVAGPVGGYNLQAAFSTGYVAGESSALRARMGR